MAQATIPQANRWQEIQAIWKDNRWLYVLAGVLLGILATPALEQITGDLNTLIGNLVPEAIGITFTVLILDRLAENRAREALKKRLIRETSGESNEQAKAAIHWMRHEEWLTIDDDIQLLKAADLWNASLQGAELSKANLQNTRFSAANLQEANLMGANLHNANLIRCNLQSTGLTYAILDKADLRHANAENAEISQASLQDANLWGTNLKNADLWCSDLQRVDLLQANLEGARLEQTNLEGSNMQSVNLHRANLLEANLTGVHFDDAKFDEQVILPDAEIQQDKDNKFMTDEQGNILYTSKSYWTPETDMSRYTDPNHPEFWEPDWVKQQRDKDKQ